MKLLKLCQHLKGSLYIKKTLYIYIYIVQFRLSRHNRFISAENIIAILSVSSDDSLHASLLSQSSEETPLSLLCDSREACKGSSDKTESITIIFSAEINLLWRLNRVWVSVIYIYIYKGLHVKAYENLIFHSSIYFYWSVMKAELCKFEWKQSNATSHLIWLFLWSKKE